LLLHTLEQEETTPGLVYTQTEIISESLGKTWVVDQWFIVEIHAFNVLLVKDSSSAKTVAVFWWIG
jgi:hypothetical protein